MRCTPSASPDRQAGSAVTGFALVAPLAVVVFVAVLQMIALGLLHTSVHSAAATGARLAATLGSGPADGARAADAMLVAHGIRPATVSKSWRRIRVSGVPYLVLTVSVPARVAWLGTTLTVRSTARVTDENAL